MLLQLVTVSVAIFTPRQQHVHAHGQRYDSPFQSEDIQILTYIYMYMYMYNC